MESKKDKYLGLEGKNNQGYDMKIVSYEGYNNIKVEFRDPIISIVKTGVGHFLDGGVSNPYAPTIYGVGMVGNKYAIRDAEENKYYKEYGIWYSMLRRCYSDNFKSKFPSYKDVVCDPIWFYFDNFYEWIHCQDNYNSIKDLDYNIDKDILVKGNREYTPNKCTLVPQYVNKLFTKNKAKRGKYPIGVIYEEKRGYYSAYCNDGKRQVHLNYYKTEQQAFNAYKEYKEKIIKKIANEEFVKGTITKKCYEAMINYQVEITD